LLRGGRVHDVPVLAHQAVHDVVVGAHLLHEHDVRVVVVDPGLHPAPGGRAHTIYIYRGNTQHTSIQSHLARMGEPAPSHVLDFAGAGFVPTPAPCKMVLVIDLNRAHAPVARMRMCLRASHTPPASFSSSRLRKSSLRSGVGCCPAPTHTRRKIMSHRSTFTLRSAAVLAAAALTLSACGGGDGAAEASAKGSEDDPIRIGVVTESEPYWEIFTDVAEKQVILVEFVNFTDYQRPKQGLADGDLDLNQFQHLQFLAGFNVNADEDLTPVGATAVYPLGRYSKAHDSLEDVPEGGEIAIPNDATNQARALLVLQEAGLVSLAGGGNSFSTPADVIAEDSKVTVTPV